MRIGIFAKTFAGTTPSKVLADSAAAGFACVQYNMACSGLSSLPEEISDEAAADVAAASKQTGVAISAISATYNMAHPSSAVRKAGRKSFAVIAAKAKAMGSNLLTLCTGSRDPNDQWRNHPHNATSDAWGDMVQEFGHLIAIAEQEDIYLGIEPELGNVVSTPAKALALIKEMQSKRLRIVFDAANLFEHAQVADVRRQIEQGVDRLSGHIALAHAKDRNAKGAPVAPGKGIIDFSHYLKTLKAAGFNGDLVAHGFAAEEAAGVAKLLKSIA